MARLKRSFLPAAFLARRLPDRERPRTIALTNTADTHLGRALATAVKANPGNSGIHALRDGRDAFAARMQLADAAERSLDVQYYIWHADTTGALLTEALWKAADRGVRVRLLLDDNNTSRLDETIATLDAHRNIEVRLFNPYANRGFRLLELVTDFARLNRRMHNKSFTADNQATIVGGRNVGDEYFGANSRVQFADLDVLAVGAVVDAVSADFDAYWNSAPAYPAAELIGPAPAGRAERMREAWAKLHASAAAIPHIEVPATTPLVRELLDGELPLEWVPARLVSDDPAKVLHPPERSDLHLAPRLSSQLGNPAHEIDVISPYFVPTEEGTAAMVAIAARGVKVRVLTNSLAATDVTPVHAGYARYRKRLLRGGVRLFELKPGARAKSADRRRRGGSDASLHAKTFAADRSRVFVGSYNLDPRSVRLNTEMGLVLDSPRLAARVSETFDREMAGNAYEVRLRDGGLEWIDGDERHASEPNTSAQKRLWVALLSILPIEWLL
jgi:putative cardiolipin synthase